MSMSSLKSFHGKNLNLADEFDFDFTQAKLHFAYTKKMTDTLLGKTECVKL